MNIVQVRTDEWACCNRRVDFHSSPTFSSPHVKPKSGERCPSGLEKRLDNLKVFATLLVVLGHVGVFYSDLGVLEFPIVPWIKIMTWLIYSFHMPLFFFISGVIYEICIEKGKYGEIGVFVCRKVKRLIIPYFFWGVAVVMPVMELLRFTEDGVGRYVINGILLGRNNRHLWYLMSLFCMFVVTDGVRRLIKNKKLWWLVLGAAVILSLLYNKAPGIFNLGSTMRCWIYFVSGIVLEGNGVLRRETKKKTVLPLIAVGIIVLCVWSFFGSFNDPVQRLIVSSIGIYVCFLVSSLIGPLPEGRFYRMVHRDSFGIYLAHPMIIYVIMAGIWKSGSAISVLVIIPVVFIAALVLAAAVTELIRKMGLRAVIGE